MGHLDLQNRLRTSVLEIRGDGKAGGGLVLAFQSLANLLLGTPGIHVQEWPFFGSARRGANIRSFLRASARPIQKACEVSRPVMVLLMDEGAAHSVDFAQGVPPGGTFVLNTRRSPAECAQHFRLAGRVVTVPGDDLGQRYLKHAIGNVSAYVAMCEAIGGFDRTAIFDAFLDMLRKRRVPDTVLEHNRAALDASFAAIRSEAHDVPDKTRHAAEPFASRETLPLGAQTPLRLSIANPTAHYAPSGFRLLFADPADACTGCAHCITNCPEGIIRFVPDPERGVLVTGADVGSFCKLCQECVAVCPEHLFTSVPYEEHWAEEEARTS